MAYNMTNFTAAVNLYEQFVAINSLSGNVLSSMFLMSIFLVVLFTFMKNNPPAESFMTASTVVTAVSLLFLLADMTNIVWVVACTLLMVASAINLMRN